MATKKEITESVMRLTKAFTAFKPDPEDMKGFMELVYEKLSGFHASIIQQAVEEIIETEIYFPRIAEMIARCCRITDKITTALVDREQSLKLDWYGDKIHPKETWQKLADEYQKYGWTTAAINVMDEYKNYGKLCEPITPEQIEQARERVKGLTEKMEAK
jgi:hypothetical protein